MVLYLYKAKKGKTMKKIIMASIIAASFTTQAQAQYYREDVLTFNAGTTIFENENIDNIDTYGVSIFRAEGAGKVSFAGGLDFFKESLGSGKKAYLIAPNVGISYGITNNLYIIPTVGFSMLVLETSTDAILDDLLDTNDEDTVDKDNTYGINVGTDLIYKMDNGFSFGLGGRMTAIDGDINSQVQLKMGFSFR